MSESPSPEASSREALRRLTVRSLALRPRLAYTALLFASATVTGVTLSLLLGEPSLPWRTRVSFAVIAAAGVAWSVFSGWVLSRRRVALGWHRVIAARMAVVFSALFTAAAIAIALFTPVHARALHALWVGVPLLGVASLQLVRARRRHDALLLRRHELTRIVESEQ